MSSKYAYLEQYINNESTNNWFERLSDAEIKTEEERLKLSFPSQLKAFWKEIGYGFLREAHTPIGEVTQDHDNRIMPPNQIADIILLKEESGLILPDVPMIEGAIPFFAIADSYSFLVMLPNSMSPEAIYDQWGDYIEKDLETFIYRLYYESPTYYLRVNDRGN